MQTVCVGAVTAEGALPPELCPWLADLEKQLQALEKTCASKGASSGPTIMNNTSRSLTYICMLCYICMLIVHDLCWHMCMANESTFN